VRLAPKLARTAISRRRSTASAINKLPTLAQAIPRTSSPASSIMLTMSAAGVARAEKTIAISTAMRQPFRIARPDMMPAKFSATRKTGRTNETPTTSSSLKTKS